MTPKLTMTSKPMIAPKPMMPPSRVLAPTFRNNLPAALLAAAIAVLATPWFLHAQPADTITRNPNAVQLRAVWQKYGTRDNQYVGYGIGGIPDINGDSIAEFSVNTADGLMIYDGSRGVLSDSPSAVLQIGQPDSKRVVTGNFWGTGHTAIAGIRGEEEVINGTTFYHTLVYVYRTDVGHVDTMPASILDPRRMTPRTRMANPIDIVGADLDGDGTDEMILLTGGVDRAGVNLRKFEVWIYKGGPNFQLDSPTVIIRGEHEREGATALYIGHWDDDQYLDMAVATDSIDPGPKKLKFFFGGPGSPWNWTVPDRSVVFGGAVVLDADGDGMLDISVVRPEWRVGLFRSGSGKSIRTRSLTPEDLDGTYYQQGYHNPARLGYLADSLRHYEMLAIFQTGGGGGPVFLGLGGGPNGPDHTYDVYSNAAIFALLEPIADVTGDGWNDLLGSYPQDNFNRGVAAVFAGGPYIPRDSTADVEEIAVAGRERAFSVWPNPMCDALHIAWRGDLRRFPARFVVHDMAGREVARGDVEPWRGEALWQAGARASGAYLLTVFDSNNQLIISIPVIKQ